MAFFNLSENKKDYLKQKTKNKDKKNYTPSIHRAQSALVEVEAAVDTRWAIDQNGSSVIIIHFAGPMRSTDTHPGILRPVPNIAKHRGQILTPEAPARLEDQIKTFKFKTEKNLVDASGFWCCGFLFKPLHLPEGS